MPQTPVTAQQVNLQLEQGMHSLSMIGSDLLLIFFILIVPIVFAVLFACSLHKAMKQVPIEKRVFPNAFIWLRFIPLAGFVFDWMMLPFGIPHGLRNAVSENKIAVRAANKLKTVGIAHFIFSFGFLVTNFMRFMSAHPKTSGPSLIALLFGIFVLFDVTTLIIYWVKIVSFRKNYFAKTDVNVAT